MPAVTRCLTMSIAHRVGGPAVAGAADAKPRDPAGAAVASSSAITLPTIAGRELRLDLFRGLALWLIFIDHLPPNLLTWFTIRNYGFSDATEIFIFISGYTAAFVYGRAMLESGFVVSTARILRRAWQIYVAHVFLFTIFLAEISYVATSFENPLYSEEMGIMDFLKQPDVTIVQALLLRFRPVNMDVLPLYIVLMLFLHLSARTIVAIPFIVATSLAATYISPWFFLPCVLIVLFAGFWFARGALVIGLAIIVSIIGTFLIMGVLGRSLNVISLAGLAFAVGMLVDNAIVVLDNAHRHYHELGETAFTASVRAVTAANHATRRPATIYTIEFGNGEPGKKQTPLQTLSERNYGSHHYVDLLRLGTGP